MATRLPTHITPVFSVTFPLLLSELRCGQFSQCPSSLLIQWHRLLFYLPSHCPEVCSPARVSPWPVRDNGLIIFYIPRSFNLPFRLLILSACLPAFLSLFLYLSFLRSSFLLSFLPFFLSFFRAALEAYGSSQARG